MKEQLFYLRMKKKQAILDFDDTEMALFYRNEIYKILRG